MSLTAVSASQNINLKILSAEHRPCQWPVSMATVSWSAWRFYVTTMSPGASRSSSSQRVRTCWKHTVQSQGLVCKGASWLSATSVNKYILLKLLGQYSWCWNWEICEQSETQTDKRKVPWIRLMCDVQLIHLCRCVCVCVSFELLNLWLHKWLALHLQVTDKSSWQIPGRSLWKGSSALATPVR